MDVKDKPKYKETGWQLSATSLVTLTVMVATKFAGEESPLADADLMEIVIPPLVALVTGMTYRAARLRQGEKEAAREEAGGDPDEDRKGDI